MLYCTNILILEASDRKGIKYYQKKQIFVRFESNTSKENMLKIILFNTD